MNHLSRKRERCICYAISTRYTRAAVLLNNAVFSAADAPADSRLNAFQHAAYRRMCYGPRSSFHR